MKYISLFIFLLLSAALVYAKPQNLYEQLCEVNQEWLKHKSTAERLGYLKADPITDEQDLLVFHLQALEQIFLESPVAHLTLTQQIQRQKHLQVLRSYWQRRDCPHNDYLSFRNPVFIDRQGRYCAVGYLMLKSGKQEFCEAVQRDNNFIFVRQIQHETFTAWQQESGLSVDELAWIQPGYVPEVRFERLTNLGKPRNPVILDSLQSVKIYNPNLDMTDMFGFERIFWGMRLDEKKEMRKYQYAHQVDWKYLKNNLGGITALTVYKGNLLVAIDTVLTVNDTTFTPKKALYQWNKKGKWEKLMDLKDHVGIYTFFETEGKLFMGGGYSEVKELNGTERQYWHSYLMAFDGTSWEQIHQEYGGIIFGLVYKDKKRYLGTVKNAMSEFDLFAPIPDLNSAAVESGK